MEEETALGRYIVGDEAVAEMLLGLRDMTFAAVAAETVLWHPRSHGAMRVVQETLP